MQTGQLSTRVARRSARRGHGWRAFGLAAAIVAALLLGADIAARAVAEHAVAGELAGALAMSHRPRVSLGGFPFLVHALSGDLPSASLDARRFTAEGLSFERVQLSLRGVRVPTGQLLSRQPGTITARDGGGTATMSDSAVSAALRRRGVPVTMRLSGGEAHLSAPGVPGDVRAKLSISDGELVLEPATAAVALSFSLHLPELVPGMSYTDVRVSGSELVLSFDLTDARFDIP